MKRRELANEYLSSFCMEVSMQLHAGITPYDCILMLLDDEQDKSGKAVLQSILVSLENGSRFSYALRETGYFPPYLVIMAEAGEKTGRLADAMKALSEHYDRQERLSNAIKNAVFYPAVLFVLMVAVVLIIIVQVLPIFNSVFNRFGVQMPPLAMKLMFFGGWLTNFCAIIATVLGIIIIAMLFALTSPSARTYVKGLLENLFGDRGIFRRITVSRIVSVMALATASGIDPENAMELAVSAGEGSKALKERHNRFIDILHSGGTFSDAMLNAGFLSARNARMLSVGARSGMTDTALTEIAAKCERDTTDEIDRLVSRIEPSLVIISSVMVGAILLMVMLPLISIMSSIG